MSARFSSANRIATLSAWLYSGTTIVYYGLPLGLIATLTPGLASPNWLLAQLTDLPRETVMTPFKYAAMIGIVWLALLPMFGALSHMRRLFRLYRVGDILTDACARHILRTGQWWVALAATSVLIKPLQSVLMTYDNPPGQRTLAISLDGTMMGFLMAGGLLIAIGWVMREAAIVAQENAGFV